MPYLLSILPFLACPLMMGVMMWVMMRGNQGQSMHGTNQMSQRPLARLAPWSDADEIADRPAPAARTPVAQMADLRARLARLQAQQEAIAGQMAELQLERGPEASPTGDEAGSGSRR